MDGRAYIPVCPQHDRHARGVIAKQGGSVSDSFMIQGQYESTNFGLQAKGSRAASALAEAPASRNLPLANPKTAGSLLKALGTDWRQIRMRRVHDHRITVDMDGARFTLYTRNG